MDAAAWGFVGTLVGAVVGAGVSVGTTLIANSSAVRLQDQADSHARTERSRAFQRETLLSVQDAAQRLARLTGRAYHDDLIAHRNGAEWGRTPLGEPLNSDLGEANRELAILEERVADDTLRGELKALHSKFTCVALAADPRAAESNLYEATSDFESVMAGLGSVLRELY